MTVAAAVVVVAPAGREGKHRTYVGAGEESHRRETIAAKAYHHREASAAAASAAAACQRRGASVAAAVAAAEACHHRETIAAATAEACHRREIPYCHPFVGLRLPRPPRPENHNRRQEYGVRWTFRELAENEPNSLQLRHKQMPLGWIEGQRPLPHHPQGIRNGVTLVQTILKRSISSRFGNVSPYLSVF